MENAPGPDDHADPKDSPVAEEGVADSATQGPEGPELHDQVGLRSEMGSPAGDTAVPTDTIGAPPAVPESQQPVTGSLGGRPQPAGAFGPERTDLVPNITEPDTARGWDSAVDLEKAPGVVPDPAEVYVPGDLRAAIEDAMRKYPDRRSAVIPALHAAQKAHGWCSPEALYQVAAVMQVTPGYLSSIASFYDQFNTEPVGALSVYVCTGVACMPHRPTRVFEALREEGEKQDLTDTEIREFECLGACDMAPMASIGGRYIGPLDPSDAPAIVQAIKDGEPALPGRGLEDSDYRLPWGGRA